MFTRPFMFNRPGKASTPFTTPRSGNPAGLRFPHRLKLCFDIFQGQQLGNNHPPQSSPFSSPVDADTSPLPDEDAPPRATIFDYFGLHASPPRPTGPIPPPKWPHQQKPSPRMTPTPAAPTTPPASTKPLPRKKMRHKQLTMNRAAIRSTLRKRHSRINVEAGLKKAQMHHERLAARARADLRHMRDEVNKTMRENAMSAEEKIFVEQLWKLHLDSVFRNDLSRHRETAERAEQETPARLQAHAEMDKEAARLREQDEEETDRQEELRVLRELTGIDVRELPWPTFKFKHFTPEEIEKNDVFAFILHVLRPVPSKSARDKVKTEVFRFHPDKFNALVLPKVREDQRELAAELAGAVVRVLNSIMEGVEKV
ncbi:hypothetical protein ID866_5916 [Astraeus odoratus]|nr:hypothetical protein ID866_5916 [Astraeus odoratus]